MIIGKTVADLGVPLTGNERHKGWALGYQPREGSDRARYMDEAQRVIESYGQRKLRVSTRAIAYRTAANLGAGHDQLDSIEDAVVMLRRSRRINMYAVRDGRSEWRVPWIAEPKDAAEALLQDLRRLRANRQQGQPWRVILLVEAAGMVPVLEDLCEEYGVRLVSGSGSVPLSVTHSIATSAINAWEDDDTGVPTAVLCITDFDLKGLAGIFAPFARDVEAFVGARYTVDPAEFAETAAKVVEVRQIAATAEQVRQYVPANLRLPPPLERCGECSNCLASGRRRACQSPRIVSWWPADFSLPPPRR